MKKYDNLTNYDKRRIDEVIETQAYDWSNTYFDNVYELVKRKIEFDENELKDVELYIKENYLN